MTPPPASSLSQTPASRLSAGRGPQPASHVAAYPADGPAGSGADSARDVRLGRATGAAGGATAPVASNLASVAPSECSTRRCRLHGKRKVTVWSGQNHHRLEPEL